MVSNSYELIINILQISLNNKTLQLCSNLPCETCYFAQRVAIQNYFLKFLNHVHYNLHLTRLSLCSPKVITNDYIGYSMFERPKGSTVLSLTSSFLISKHLKVTPSKTWGVHNDKFFYNGSISIDRIMAVLRVKITLILNFKDSSEMKFYIPSFLFS